MVCFTVVFMLGNQELVIFGASIFFEGILVNCLIFDFFLMTFDSMNGFGTSAVFHR